MANSSAWHTSGDDASGVHAVETEIHFKDDWTSRSLQPSHVTPNLSHPQLQLYNAQSGLASIPLWNLTIPQPGQPIPFAECYQTQQDLYDQPFGAMDFLLDDFRATNNSLFPLLLQDHQYQRQRASASQNHAYTESSLKTHNSMNYELPRDFQVTSSYQQPVKFTRRNNAGLQPHLFGAECAVGRTEVHQRSLHSHADARRRSSIVQQPLEFGERLHQESLDLHAPKPQRRVPISAVIGMASPLIDVTAKGLQSTKFDPVAHPSHSGREEHIHRQWYIEQEWQEPQIQRYLQQPQPQAQRRSSRAKAHDASTSVPATSKISSLALAHIYPRIDSPSHLNPFILHQKILDDIPTNNDMKQSSRYISRSGMNNKEETQLPPNTVRTVMQGPSSNAAPAIAANRKDSNVVVPTAEMLKSVLESATEHRKSGELYLSRSKDMIRRTSGGGSKGSKLFNGKVSDDAVHRYHDLPPAYSSPPQAQSKNINPGISDDGCLGRNNTAPTLLHTEQLLSANISTCEPTKDTDCVHHAGTLPLGARMYTGSDYHSPNSPLLDFTVSSTAVDSPSLSPSEHGPISQPEALCRSQTSPRFLQNSPDSNPVLTPGEALPSVSPTSEQGKRLATPSTDPLPRPFKQPKMYPWSRGAQSKTPQTKAPRPKEPRRTCTKSPSTQTTPGRAERSTKYPKLQDSDLTKSPGSPLTLQQLATPGNANKLPLPQSDQPPTNSTDSSRQFWCVQPQPPFLVTANMPSPDPTVKRALKPIMPTPSNASIPPPSHQSWRPPLQHDCRLATPSGPAYHHHQLPISPEVQAHRQPPQPYQPAYDNMPPPFHPVQRPYILEGRTDNHANRLVDSLAKKARIEGELWGEEWASIPSQPQPEYHYGETEAACPTCSRSQIWNAELRRARHDRYVGKPTSIDE